jgi:hypothetical protein
MNRQKSRFIEIGNEIGQTVETKNKAYGDASAKSGDFLRLLWPNGVPPEQYDDMLAMARMFDKQMRIATSKDALGENPYMDIGGYAILGVERGERKKGD